MKVAPQQTPGCRTSQRDFVGGSVEQRPRTAWFFSFFLSFTSNLRRLLLLGFRAYALSGGDFHGLTASSELHLRVFQVGKEGL